MLSRRRGRRASEGGQAIVEFCVVVIVALSLLLGVYSVANFASNKQTAGQAVREGARVAVELGNTQATAAPGCSLPPDFTDPTCLDAVIVSTTLSMARQMNNVTIREIDVYLPCSAQCTPESPTAQCRAGTAPDDPYTNGDPADRYQVTDAATGRYVPMGVPGYTLDRRVNVHPNEAPIAVRLVYDYHTPVPGFPFTPGSEVSAVMCLPPSYA